MKSTSKGLLILIALGFMGIWGCSQNNNGHNARLRELEARYAKLEEDHQTATAANENFRKRLTQVESQRVDFARKVDDLQAAIKEKEQQVTARTGERDALHSQLIQFAKDLQSLAGRIETAATEANRTMTTGLEN
jgi:chromosome segregation ATPase